MDEQIKVSIIIRDERFKPIAEDGEKISENGKMKYRKQVTSFYKPTKQQTICELKPKTQTVKQNTKTTPVDFPESVLKQLKKLIPSDHDEKVTNLRIKNLILRAILAMKDGQIRRSMK